MGIRYTVRKKGGEKSPGYGQVVTPRAPKEDAKYWNPETGEVRTVSSKEKNSKQPTYSRGVANRQTSPRLRGLNGCIRHAMAGRKFDGKLESMQELNEVSKTCKLQLDEQGIPGGIPEQLQTSFEE